MNNDMLDILVGGIAGAAGEMGRQSREEVSWLRELSLAQLKAKSGKDDGLGKGTLRVGDSKALAEVRYAESEGMLPPGSYEKLSASPEGMNEAAILVAGPELRAWLDARTDKLTAEYRVGEGSSRAEAADEASVKNWLNKGTLSENRDRVQSLAASMKDMNMLSEDFNVQDLVDKDSVENFANRADVKAFAAGLEASVQTSVEGRFGRPSELGAQAAEQESARLSRGEQLSVPERSGDAAGKAKVSELNALFSQGYASTDYADATAASVDVVKNVEDVWKTGPLWEGKPTSISLASSDATNTYLLDRAEELISAGEPKNKVQNILAREANTIASINMQEMFSDVVIPFSERENRNIGYRAEDLAPKVEQIRAIVQGRERGNIPSATPSAPIVGTAVGEDDGVATVEAPGFMTEVPLFEAQNKGQAEDSVTGPSIAPDGSINLSTPARGNTEQIEQQARELVIEYLKSDDDQDIFRRARDMVAQLPPTKRNGLSADQYIQQLIGRMIMDARK